MYGWLPCSLRLLPPQLTYLTVSLPLSARAQIGSCYHKWELEQQRWVTRKTSGLLYSGPALGCLGRDRTRLHSVWGISSGHEWSFCPVKKLRGFTAAIILALWGEQNRIPSWVWASFYSLHSTPMDIISFLGLVLDWCPLSGDMCVSSWPAAPNTEHCLDSLIKKSSQKHHYPSLVTEQRRRQW